MADQATIGLVLVWEHELRSAAKLLHQFSEYAKKPESESDRGELIKMANDCLSACASALRGLHEEPSYVVLHNGNPDEIVPRIISVQK